MLIFSGFTSHTPILIPNIGKENLGHLSKTLKALEILEYNLVKSNPDTIIIFSGHHSFLTDHFIINLNAEYRGDFQQFSDLSTELSFRGDLLLINEIRDKIENEVPLTLKSDINLEYGVLASLFYLTKKLPQIKIVPISYSLANKDDHFKFGELLKDVIFESDKRIAVVAAGDLSHTLSKDSPGGFSEIGASYDQIIIDLLKAKDIKGILEIDSKILTKSKECSYRSLLMLLGLIHNMNYEVNILSYEHPFGVGYLTVNFNLK